MTRVRKALACGVVASALVLGLPGAASANLSIPPPGSEEWDADLEELDERLEWAICGFFRNCDFPTSPTPPPPPPDPTEPPLPDSPGPEAPPSWVDELLEPVGTRLFEARARLDAITCDFFGECPDDSEPPVPPPPPDGNTPPI